VPIRKIHRKLFKSVKLVYIDQAHIFDIATLGMQAEMRIWNYEFDLIFMLNNDVMGNGAYSSIENRFVIKVLVTRYYTANTSKSASS